MGYIGIFLEKLYGAPERTRTSDPQFRKLMLYPLSYGRLLFKDTLNDWQASALICSLKSEAVRLLGNWFALRVQSDPRMALV